MGLFKRKGKMRAAEAEALQGVLDALETQRSQELLLALDALSRLEAISLENQGLAAELFVKAMRMASSEEMRRTAGTLFFAGPNGTLTPLEELARSIPQPLLERGLSPVAVCEGKALLFHAIELESAGFAESFARLLLDSGADANSPGPDGHSPLGAHLLSGHFLPGSRFKSYLRNGARLNDADLADPEVIRAVFESALVEVALELPADLIRDMANRVFEGGDTLLHCAARRRFALAHMRRLINAPDESERYEQVLRLLLESGADAQTRNDAGLDARGAAAEAGYADAFELLHGWMGSHGQAPSEETAAHVSELSSSGAMADPSPDTLDAPIKGRETLLFAASYHGYSHVVAALLAKGVNPNIPSLASNGSVTRGSAPDDVWSVISGALMRRFSNPHAPFHPELGIPALYFPVLHKDDVVVDALLSAGADPNQRALDGLFPLYLATERGAIGIARSLIEHGADVNMTAFDGTTALINAARKGRLPLVELLVEAGAQTELKDGQGQSALDHARSSRRYNVVRFLLNREEGN